MSGQGKGMSSRLLTMKFMQRAAINAAKSESAEDKKSPVQDNASGPSKRQRTSRDSYSVPNNSTVNFPSPYSPHPSTPQTAGSNVAFGAGSSSSASELATIAEALKSEDEKRAAAVAKQAADAGQEQWVMDYGDVSVPEPNGNAGSQQLYILPPTTITGQGDEDEDDENDESDAELRRGGKMRFGGFKSKSRQASDDSSKQGGTDAGEQADDLIEQYSGTSRQQRTNRHGGYKEPNLKNLTSLSGKGGISTGGGGGGGSNAGSGGIRKDQARGNAKGNSKGKSKAKRKS